ncbi:MAG: hypothetical protein V1819_04080 [bacterium]
MTWLIVTILSYLILAVAFLVDKYLLIGSISNPKVYTFYVGMSGILALALIPFVGFYIPGAWQIFLALACGIFFTGGLFWFYKALRLFEPSRVVPAVGGILPVFSFLLILIFSKGKAVFSPFDCVAFVLLILGSVLITYKKSQKISLKCLFISSVAAILLAFYFVLAKYVYLGQSFWTGLIWIRIGGFLAALGLLLTREVRSELFKAKIGLQKKTAVLFLSNQAAGAGGNILQSWAIALAPLAYVATINALAGIQYVFLFIFSIMLSFKFPKILKEEISKEVIIQKIVAILLIGGGLLVLALK